MVFQTAAAGDQRNSLRSCSAMLPCLL